MKEDKIMDEQKNQAIEVNSDKNPNLIQYY